MDFGNKAAFAAFGVILLILAMYFFKHKNKPINVPNLRLWSEAVKLNSADSSRHKLNITLLLILQIAAASMLIVCLAEPYIVGGSVSNTAFVIDRSLSMQAKNGEKSRFDTAVDEIQNIISGLSPQAEISILTLDDEPEIIINKTKNKNQAVSALLSIQPKYGTVDANKTAALLETLFNENNTVIYVMSDNPAVFTASNSINKSINSVQIGESADNTALTALSCIADGSSVTAYAGVENYSDKTVSKTISLYADNKILDYRTIELPPNASSGALFTEVPYSAELKAVINESDALEADNVRFASVNSSSKRKIAVAANDNIFLNSALSIIEDAEIINIQPEAAGEMENVDLFVFDSVLPNNIPQNSNLLIINPPVGNSFLNISKNIAPSGLYLTESSIFDLIETLDFEIKETKQLGSWGEPALYANETPLIAIGSNGNANAVVIGFDLHNTDLPLKKEFPILINNIIQYLIPAEITNESEIYAGELTVLNINPKAESVKIVMPDNTIIDDEDKIKTDTIGIYTVMQIINNSEIYDNFAVNPNCLESDLRMTAQSTNNASHNAYALKNMQLLLVVIILIILAAEWWVYNYDA